VTDAASIFMSAPELPGFTADQTYVITTVIQQSVAKGIQEGLESYRRDNCLGHQVKTDRLMATVYGNGTTGLDEQIRTLLAFEARVNRLTWLVVVQCITFLGAVAYALIL